MSLFFMTFTGGSFILLGTWESLTSQTPTKSHRFSTISLISTTFLSLLFIIHALFSIFDALNSNDKLGFSLQLQVISISFLFLMFSLLGIATNLSKRVRFPYPLINLVLLFGFVEEFLLFYLHLKDPKGIENRYFSLMLVPISVCMFSTMIELKSPDSNVPRLGRGIGLILQGTWFVQMGFSFFSNLIAHNCVSHSKSRGNYTIKCMGHMDTHRGGAIAVLLFNCHLAFLLAVISGVYSVFGSRFVGGGDYRRYKPIGGEVQNVDNQPQFTLDSDSDDGGIHEIKHEGSSDGLRIDNSGIELAVNGYGIHK